MKQNFLHTNQPATDEVLTNDSSVNPMLAADCEAAANIGRSPRLLAARVAPPGATKLKAQPIIHRAWAMPSMHTYTIKPIGILLRRYGVGAGWIDPFAGEYSTAEWTNDLNPNKPTLYHLEAFDFLKQLEGEYVGGLYDPPYSLRQIVECYEGVGQPLDKKWATTKFYTDTKNAMTEKIQIGGLVITCGWNTIGMGKKRGFRLEEILMVCHGRLHNDTLVTVERKVWKQERLRF